MRQKKKFQLNLGIYFKDQILLILLHVVCLLLLCGFLYVTGYTGSHCVLIAAVWVLILTVWLLAHYISRAKYFNQIEAMMEQVDQRYLLGELMPSSHRLEDQIFREMIRSSNKSMIERLCAIEDERQEYREYIESWVHEIKAPITGIALMCENHKDDITRQIWLENHKIENYVDMALYYARSDEVYKDYMIRDIDLDQVVTEALLNNKQLLVQQGVRVEKNCHDHVFTDGKWIGFILNQLFLNSVKYRQEEAPCILIFTESSENQIRLIVKDNGIGIKAEELARIFEKGFTGSNGRSIKKSTGMGLYLCKKLCKKLGIKIQAESKENEGTSMCLTFPVSSYLTKM